MSTDVLSEPASQPANDVQRPGNPSRSHAERPRSSGRWWKLGLTFILLSAVVAGVIAFAWAGASSSGGKEKLTHTIARGDLLVTVTEQGTVESSNNTEIKCRIRGFSTVTWIIDGGTYVEPGDELVRLDTKTIEENLSLSKTNVHTAVATLERSKADVASADIAINAYLKGRYESQLKSFERELNRTKSNLETARKILGQSQSLYSRGYANSLELEGNTFAVTQAELEHKVIKTQIEVLKKYTREMNLETLNGNLIASKSKLEADKAGLKMDEIRRDRAMQELEDCVIKSDRSGMVIYPSAAAWKNTPDVTEGASVRHDQVLLLMPDLSKMQVKVGIHESVIDRVRPGLPASVTLPETTLAAEVSSVSSVTRPAGWWTGNVVKYDTIVDLPESNNLKPGMSAEIEITLASHKDVLTIPVAAVVETEAGSYCWILSAEGEERRALQLGDSNDVFIVVEQGLKEGDKVILNPLAMVEEAQDQALQAVDGNEESADDSEATEQSSLEAEPDETPLNSAAGK